MSQIERIPQGVTLLADETTTAVGEIVAVPFAGGQAIFQSVLYGTSGTVSATVNLYGSNDPLAKTSQTNAAKETLATFSLSGTAAGATGARADSGVWAVQAPYRYFWGEVSAISGTGAAASLFGGF